MANVNEVETKTPAEVMKDIQKRVAAKIKSKAFAVTSVVGKAQLLEVTNRDGLDYTVGGLFNPRWVLNFEERIQIARFRGFVFPDEVDSSFKRLTLGNMVLMLQTQESKRDYGKQLEVSNRSLESGQMANYGKAVKDKHLDFEDDVITPGR